MVASKQWGVGCYLLRFEDLKGGSEEGREGVVGGGLWGGGVDFVGGGEAGGEAFGSCMRCLGFLGWGWYGGFALVDYFAIL